MEPVRQVTGTLCPIDHDDIDTDQIIPKQYLKRIDRSGFGPFAFAEWRYDEHGEPDPDFPMNRPEHAGASILLTGRNFGCGSSREHAPWALEDAGFRAIIAESFADIFRNNCAKIGVVTVQLPGAVVRRLFDAVDRDPDVEVTVDVAAARVHGAGVDQSFPLDPHTQTCLLEGLDDVALTLQHTDAIGAYERRRPSWRPRVPA